VSECACSLQCVSSLLALQPHSRGLQKPIARKCSPEEETGPRAGDTAVEAVRVPEPAFKTSGTVRWIMFRRGQVIIVVFGAEHHAVVLAECIRAGVAWEPVNVQPVVEVLRHYSERTVLSHVPLAVAAGLQVEPQLVAVGHCQLTESIVANPVVATCVTETSSVVRPWTVEELRSVFVKVLLDQYWLAVNYSNTSGQLKVTGHNWSVYSDTCRDLSINQSSINHIYLLTLIQYSKIINSRTVSTWQQALTAVLNDKRRETHCMINIF